MSVLSHLTSTASNLLTKGPAAEGINTSVATLKARLDSYFTTDLREQLTFGSWPRRVSLPQTADQYTDVDYMVVFKGDTSSKPETLLARLRRFVEAKYSSSESKQSHPTILLSLDHINFELVPAVRLGDMPDGTLQIPSVSSSYADWQSTFPYYASSRLDDHNNANDYLSRPLIRLLKYWNCQADPYSRPCGSFELEEFIVGKSFYPKANLKDYFYGAVEGLQIAWDLAESKKERIARLKEIVAKTKQFERDEMPISAEIEIKKAIPDFT